MIALLEYTKLQRTTCLLFAMFIIPHRELIQLFTHPTSFIQAIRFRKRVSATTTCGFATHTLVYLGLRRSKI